MYRKANLIAVVGSGGAGANVNNDGGDGGGISIAGGDGKGPDKAVGWNSISTRDSTC